tara:strand:- start:629 stop:763 length:135 start_codon:yes stop_codon:yes gene_type:complete
LKKLKKTRVRSLLLIKLINLSIKRIISKLKEHGSILLLAEELEY